MIQDFDAYRIAVRVQVLQVNGYPTSAIRKCERLENSDRVENLSWVVRLYVYTELRCGTLRILQVTVDYTYIGYGKNGQSLTPVVRRNACVQYSVLRGLAGRTAYTKAVARIVARLQTVNNNVTGSINEYTVPLLTWR